MWLYSRMLGISSVQRVTNVKVVRRMIPDSSTNNAGENSRKT